MSRYAARTQVSEEKSRSEIERILSRYGATRFMYGWNQDSAIIAFEAKGRNIRFQLPMPDKKRFTVSAYEQNRRQRWRALTLAIKAKLETVESGISTFENEFMAFIVLPNGMNVSEWLSPQIQEAYQGDKPMPLMLMSGHQDKVE